MDYLDELTGLNCPPSFGSEYSYDEYLKRHETERKYYDYHSNTNYSGFQRNNQDHSSSHEACDELGNCGPFTFPHEHLPTQHYPLYHQHDHDHDQHLGQNIHLPFFPHTHTNHHSPEHPVSKVTPRPAMKKSENCGMLPKVSSSSIKIYPWIARLAYLNTSKYA